MRASLKEPERQPAQRADELRWSVVVPYYNERPFLPAMLASMIAQSVRPFRLTLVDNASTDGSGAAARAALAEAEDIDIVHLVETTPGQAAALERGIAEADTDFIAICDADTIYPPDYLARAGAQYDALGPGAAAILATAFYDEPGSLSSRLARLKMRIVPHLLRKQCHAGGYAHTFRTDALKRAGGYSRKLWPHLRKDHELMHRVWKEGRVVHDPGLWCRASDRRSSVLQKRWTLFERILYHATPFQMKDWFFYDFLGPRMAARAHDELRLRERPWEGTGKEREAGV
ncbi:glycosyltransferase family 2 protein [Hyphococcus luteus]|uniref:glycosyltransferase family 2 protein n=1 Tax=Hyphococcus luteus TaxID=2058213 RepID=UPI0013FE330F|nr:glycosyltransferase family 2 protein [Marinicaulis flavus]